MKLIGYLVLLLVIFGLGYHIGSLHLLDNKFILLQLLQLPYPPLDILVKSL